MSRLPSLFAGVAILDAETAFAEGLAAALCQRGDSVCTLSAIDIDGDAQGLAGADIEALVVDPAASAPRCLRLIAALHRRGGVGILVLTSQATATRVSELATAGADLVLDKPVGLEQVLHAIDLVRAPHSEGGRRRPVWTLERQRRRLIAPGGAEVHVSDADRRLLECFADAAGGVVPRDRLKHIVGHGLDLDLNACVYRLRRRIANVAGMPLPLRAKSGDGYVFTDRIDLD
jgi:DNA-binding response OmpR family regulator